MYEYFTRFEAAITQFQELMSIDTDTLSCLQLSGFEEEVSRTIETLRIEALDMNWSKDQTECYIERLVHKHLFFLESPEGFRLTIMDAKKAYKLFSSSVRNAARKDEPTDWKLYNGERGLMAWDILPNYFASDEEWNEIPF